MDPRLELARSQANHARYRATSRDGFYESFFQRANHPTRPLAFWIRYTLFVPRGEPEAAIGELWSIYFDGERNRHTAAKAEVPISQARFASDAFAVRVGDAELGPGRLVGAITSGGDPIRWDLTYGGGDAPLFLFPLALYDAPLPRAKSLVGVPLARYRGTLRVGDEEVAVDDWVGSQNHNWGTRHTDRYAWGQVAGFDDHPESFLEVGSAKLKLGPVWSPLMTPVVLRHRGHEYALNGVRQIVKNRASYRYFDWHFEAEDDAVRIDGRIHARREDFVGLRYGNPPGGSKHCLNSKIAACTVTVTPKGESRPAETLRTANRAAFEILTDTDDHGVAVRF